MNITRVNRSEIKILIILELHFINSRKKNRKNFMYAQKRKGLSISYTNFK